MGLYEEIKTIAEKRGYTIKKIEEELDLPRSSISKYNKNVPSFDKICKIAHLLKVPVDFFSPFEIEEIDKHNVLIKLINSLGYEIWDEFGNGIYRDTLDSSLSLNQYKNDTIITLCKRSGDEFIEEIHLKYYEFIELLQKLKQNALLSILSYSDKSSDYLSSEKEVIDMYSALDDGSKRIIFEALKSAYSVAMEKKDKPDSQLSKVG